MRRHEVDAHDDVAPLVAAAHLQRHAVAPAQLHEVVALQQHVVELDEAQRLVAVEPQLHAVHGQHAVHAEMPAHLAQEGDVAQLVQPLGIVEHDARCPARRRRSAGW
jgi:hypothetical protein